MIGGAIAVPESSGNHAADAAYLPAYTPAFRCAAFARANPSRAFNRSQ